MKIIIERGSNGATIKTKQYGQQVYQFKENEVERLLDLLCFIRDELCLGMRYDKERVSIIIKHGDKYECEDKKCEICKKE